MQLAAFAAPVLAGFAIPRAESFQCRGALSSDAREFSLDLFGRTVVLGKTAEALIKKFPSLLVHCVPLWIFVPALKATDFERKTFGSAFSVDINAAATAAGAPVFLAPA